MTDIDKFMRMTSSVSGLDKTFRLIVYTVRLLLSVNTRTSLEVRTRLINLIALLMETRVCMRLLGVVPVWTHFQRNLSDKLMKPMSTSDQVDVAQTVSLLVYYLSEGMYFLHLHKCLPTAKVESVIVTSNSTVIQSVQMDSVTLAYKWSRISCRGWAAWLMVEAAVKLQKLYQEYQQDKTLKLTMQDKLRLVGLACDIPLSVHWSLESYPLSEGVVSLLGLLSALCATRLQWESA